MMADRTGQSSAAAAAEMRQKQVTLLSIGWPWLIYGALLAVIFGVAAYQRFHIPQTPLIDDDIRGYLQPALSKLQGHPFQHTRGRNFLYPTFLWLALGTFHDYRSISIIQHVAGLLTGGLLAIAWNVLLELSAPSQKFIWYARFLGLWLVADFLWSRSPLMFEQTIRPEAVFPFFLALSFLQNFCALHARFVRLRPRVECWCLGANLFATLTLQALKPSFGFGVLAANLPLMYFLVARKARWQFKVTTVVTALVAAGLLLILPESWLKQGDPGAITFLPTTLFTIHAVPIHEQIIQDLRSGQTGPYDAAWLAGFNEHLEHALATSREPVNGPWQTLGINADYLLYRDSVFRDYFPRGQPSRIARFCYYYYWRTWRYRPGEMIKKVGRQLASVYPLRSEAVLAQQLHVDMRRKHWTRWFFHGQLPATWSRRFDQPLAGAYQQTWQTCQSEYQKLSTTPESQTFLKSVETLQTTGARTGEPAWVFYSNDLLSKGRLPLLLATVFTAAWLFVRQNAKCAPLVAAVGLVFVVNFAMFLTVGVVHSLDIERYVETQLLLTQWSGYAAILLTGNLIATFTAKPAPNVVSTAG